MENLLGTSLGVFIAITVVVMGFVAFATGQGLANTWRPIWQVFVYAALLGLADRFLVFALFDGQLSLVSGYLIDGTVLTVIALVAYRVTRVRRMVTQYPWLYERTGLFSWRERQTD